MTAPTVEPGPAFVVWPDCGHTFREDDPRLESDDCPTCFTDYHRAVTPKEHR